MKINKKTYNLLFICFVLIFSLFMFSCKSCKDDGKIDVPKTNYYVTFEYDNGTSSNMVMVEENKTIEKPSTDPKKEGFTFLYWSLNDHEFDFNTPITSHITLVAVYVSNEIKTTRVRWTEDESITYVYENGVPRTVELGTIVEFEIKESPYYEGDLEVFVNDTLIVKNSNNKYSFKVTEEITYEVSVSGLKESNNKISGSGTLDNPYIINNEAQFKTFIEGVNQTSDTRYNSAYFVLESDLDFNGYAIETIGTKLNENQFSGHFDGKNHTISNFELKEKNGIFGLFGYLVTAEISNLFIDADLTSTTSNDSYNLIGGLVAYNIGSDIINCGYNGTITVLNNIGGSSKTYVGGLIGYMQSYSTTNSSILSHSYSTATIISSGEYDVASVGGLVGYLYGTSEEVPAYIYSSYFNGVITGTSQISGGICGTIDEFTSIAECYSKGIINADSTAKNTASGAIAGHAKCESSISNSFSNATLNSTNKHNDGTYILGDIIGISSVSGESGIISNKVLSINNYYTNSDSILIDSIKYDINRFDDIVKLLNWNKNNWNNDFTPNFETSINVEFEITFDFGTELTYEGKDGNDLTQTKDIVKTNTALPIYWVYNGSGKNTFVADNNEISYGYFLDKECTIGINTSYLISCNMTVYVGFADYSEVVGEYYINLNNIEIKLNFESNGKLSMQYDGIVENYVFTYDGNKITIYDAYFAQIEYPKLSSVITEELDYFAEKKGDNLIIYDNAYFPLEDELEINAYIKNNAMGTWYSNNFDIYKFYGNKTGTINDVSTFIYDCTGNIVTLTIGKQKITATISSDLKEIVSEDGLVLSITKFDEFIGTYESDFTLQQTIKFDGLGGVIYNNNTYSYTINDEIVTFDKYTAYFNDDKLLVVTDGQEEVIFGREGSFIGSWTDTIIDYWVTFTGITKDGYGYGYDSYGFTFTYILDSAQSGLDNFITMYVGTTMYGYGELAVGKDGTKMLYLAVYTPERGMIVDDYNVCYMDSFYGTWHGEDGMSLTFNGLGGYDIYEFIYSLDKYWDVRGFVTIEEEGNTVDVRYKYDLNTNEGQFEYNGKVYNISVKNDKLVVNGVLYNTPDSLELDEYQYGDLIFTFNGKSLVNLGKVEINNHGNILVYDYLINEGIVEIYDGNSLIYTIDLKNDFEITDILANVTNQLGLYHSIIGNTYALSNYTTIEFNEKFNILGVTKAIMISSDNTYEIEVVYIDNSYVALYLGDTFLYYAYYLNEKCAAICNINFEVISVMATPDDLIGKWVNKNGERVVFDGLSNASDYIYASCVITEEDEIGSYLESYSYCFVEDHYEITSIENGREVVKYKVYFENVENSVEYVKDDVSIYIVKVSD